MREGWHERLWDDFPALYFLIRDNEFWCICGWEPLLRRLSERITRIVQSLPLEAPISVDESSVSMGTSTKTEQDAGLLAKGYCVVAVKEEPEFGGLWFVMNKSTREIEQAIYEAKEESLRTCFMCGRPGELRTHTPLKFVGCDEHSEQVEEPIKFFGLDVSPGGNALEIQLDIVDFLWSKG